MPVPHLCGCDHVGRCSGSTGKERVSVVPAERLVPALDAESDALRQPVVGRVHQKGGDIEGGSARGNDARISERVQI